MYGIKWKKDLPLTASVIDIPARSVGSFLDMPDAKAGRKRG